MLSSAKIPITIIASCNYTYYHHKVPLHNGIFLGAGGAEFLIAW